MPRHPRPLFAPPDWSPLPFENQKMKALRLGARRRGPRGFAARWRSADGAARDERRPDRYPGPSAWSPASCCCGPRRRFAAEGQAQRPTIDTGQYFVACGCAPLALPWTRSSLQAEHAATAPGMPTRPSGLRRACDQWRRATWTAGQRRPESPASYDKYRRRVPRAALRWRLLGRGRPAGADHLRRARLRRASLAKPRDPARAAPEPAAAPRRRAPKAVPPRRSGCVSWPAPPAMPASTSPTPSSRRRAPGLAARRQRRRRRTRGSSRQRRGGRAEQSLRARRHRRGWSARSGRARREEHYRGAPATRCAPKAASTSVRTAEHAAGRHGLRTILHALLFTSRGRRALPPADHNATSSFFCHPDRRRNTPPRPATVSTAIPACSALQVLGC